MLSGEAAGTSAGLTAPLAPWLAPSSLVLSHQGGARLASNVTRGEFSRKPGIGIFDLGHDRLFLAR